MYTYCFIDEYGNPLDKAPKLLDKTLYTVLWDSANGAGVFTALGAELKEWALAADIYPLSINFALNGYSYAFDSLRDMLDCLKIRVDSQLAKTLRFLLPVNTFVFSPYLINDYKDWMEDYKRGKDWNTGWRTYFVKENDDQDTLGVFSGEDIWGKDAVTVTDMLKAAVSNYKRFGEPDNNNEKIPWYAENMMTRTRTYFCTVSRVTYKNEEGRYKSEYIFGFVPKEEAMRRHPDYTALRSETNHEPAWKNS